MNSKTGDVQRKGNLDAEATDWPDRAEIEKCLDRILPDILESAETMPVMPGWHLMRTLEIVKINVAGVSIPFLSEERADELIALAATNPYAFDLASYIAGMNILVLSGRGTNLSRAMNGFAASVLTGVIKRPTQRGRPRASDTNLSLRKYSLCKFVEATTFLNLTRNDEAGRERIVETYTACDAVAEAFTRAGKPTTYANLKSLCYDETHREIRLLAEHIGLLDFDDA